MRFYHNLLLFLLMLSYTFTASATPLLKRKPTLSLSFNSLPKPYLAPYYVYFGNASTPKLADAYNTLGMRSAIMGFLSAPVGECNLTADIDVMKEDMASFVEKGGAISLSFGGFLQNKDTPRQHIQQACNESNALADVIKSAMSKYQTHNLEFDIEDKALTSDTASALRLGTALTQVRNDIPDTHITYTLGCNSKGLPPPELAYLQATKNSSLEIDVLTLMLMNMGEKEAVDPSKKAITAAASQLAGIYNITAISAMQKMGMLPAIGVDNGEVVTNLTSATQLVEFAKTNQLSAMSYWDFNRDFPGGDTKSQSTGTSSSPDQTENMQFFKTMQTALGTSAK